jgi:hypothetical protein
MAGRRCPADTGSAAGVMAGSLDTKKGISLAAEAPKSAPSLGQSVRRASLDGIELTPSMIRAGVDAYRRWNYEEEEIEALVVEIYLQMIRAK